LSGRDGDRYAPVRTSVKAKYFLFWGLTRFRSIRSDLPVGHEAYGANLSR
jgi:hypothetical protein